MPELKRCQLSAELAELRIRGDNLPFAGYTVQPAIGIA